MDGNSTRTAIGLLLLVITSILHADSVYVKDSLRVGVRTEPSNSIAPIGVVLTGMQLEVLERSGGYVKIRTDRGLEGWIKNSYVDTEPPAIIKLKRLQSEYDQLKSRVGKHDDLLKTTETTNKTLNEQIDTLKSSNAELQLALAKEQHTNSQSVSSYFWLALSYIAFCAAGIGIGVTWHRRLAMKRLGGLRF